MLEVVDRRYTVQDHDVVFDTTGDYVLRVKDLPDDERPREKLLESGPQSLNLSELVALVWGVGTRKEEVLSMAKRTLQEYGSKAITEERNPERLANLTDIPLIKACQLVASFELGRRFYAVGPAGRPVQVRNLLQAYQYLKDMGTYRKEQLRGLYLDSRYRVIHDEVISIGSLTSNIVHPREVFQPAIEHGAVAVIIAHNHPSGVLEPTTADIKVTQQLLEASQILGIDLLDHLIIAKNRHVSVLQCLPE